MVFHLTILVPRKPIEKHFKSLLSFKKRLTILLVKTDNLLLPRQIFGYCKEVNEKLHLQLVLNSDSATWKCIKPICCWLVSDALVVLQSIDDEFFNVNTVGFAN